MGNQCCGKPAHINEDNRPKGGIKKKKGGDI